MKSSSTPDTTPLFDAVWLRSFRRKLRTWYGANARDLPWRGTSDPYRIWLSEVMLQQTQVETVKAYFQRFVVALPTIRALASAEEEQVLRLWEGLGYYRRARQLHKAAKIIVEEHNGLFPTEAEQVARLPGIGRYTAGAILSIAFDQRRPILEANTVRLFSRLVAFDGDPLSSAGQKLLWSVAETLLPQKATGQFNQALMELGGMVCRPRDPQCEACPAAGLCRAQIQGRQLQLPRPKTPKQFEAVREAAVIVRRGQRVLLLRWPEGQRWAGLWDFPRFPLNGQDESSIARALIDGVEGLTGLTIRPGPLRTTLRHGVTRFRITLECYDACLAADRRRPKRLSPSLECKWVAIGDLAHHPLSSTGRKLAILVEKRPSASG